MYMYLSCFQGQRGEFRNCCCATITSLSVHNSTSMTDNKVEIQCYICLESKTTEDNPIRRDCGCSGTAGWVHVQCVIESAKSKGGLLHPSWTMCGVCTQPFAEPTKRALEEAMLPVLIECTETYKDCLRLLRTHCLVYGISICAWLMGIELGWGGYVTLSAFAVNTVRLLRCIVRSRILLKRCRTILSASASLAKKRNER